MLTLHEYMWIGDGPRHDGNRRAIAFDVFGLPQDGKPGLRTCIIGGKFSELTTACIASGPARTGTRQRPSLL